MFLRKTDYFKRIQEDDLDVIIEDVTGTPLDAFLFDMQAAALAEVQSYLRNRYNVAKIFAPLAVWDVSKAYEIGEYVVISPLESGAIYTALTDNTGLDPTANPNDWELNDSRDALMKLYLIDVTMYHIHSRINPRNIQALAMSRRDEAVKWLKMVSKGEIQLDLPVNELDEETSGERISWGSEDKRLNSY